MTSVGRSYVRLQRLSNIDVVYEREKERRRQSVRDVTDRVWHEHRQNMRHKLENFYQNIETFKGADRAFESYNTTMRPYGRTTRLY